MRTAGVLRRVHLVVVLAAMLILVGSATAVADGPRTDLYGDPLPDGATARLGSVRYYIGLGSSTVAFSPDGETLTAASDFWPTPLRFWDAGTGRLVRALPKLGRPSPGGPVTCVAFSPDGRLVAAGDTLGTVRVGRTDTGERLHQLTGLSRVVRTVFFSADGSQLVAGDDDHTLWFWEAATGRRRRRLPGIDVIYGVALSTDGETIAVGHELSVRLVDAVTGRAARSFHGHDDRVRAVAFAPDGKTVASSADDRTVRLWDLQSAQQLRQFTTYRLPVGLIVEDLVHHIAFSPDGRYLAAGDRDERICLWDIATGHLYRRFMGSTIEGGFAFSPDGALVVSGGPYFRLWDVRRGREIVATPRSDRVEGVAYAPDGTTVATADHAGLVRLWEADTGRELRRLTGHKGVVFDVAYAPDGRSLVSCGDDGTARLWDRAAGREIRIIARLSNAIMAVDFSPNGRTVALAGEDGDVLLCDIASGHLQKLASGAMAFDVAFAPDGDTLAVASTHVVTLWRVRAGVLAHTLPHPEGAQAVAFSPDAKRLATGDIEGHLRLWDVASGRLARVIPEAAAPAGCEQVIRAVAYSPDGQAVAVAGDHGSVRIRDTETGRELRQFTGHRHGVNALAFRPDGRALVTGSEDSSALVWDLAQPADRR